MDLSGGRAAHQANGLAVHRRSLCVGQLIHGVSPMPGSGAATHEPEGPSTGLPCGRVSCPRRARCASFDAIKKAPDNRPRPNKPHDSGRKSHAASPVHLLRIELIHCTHEFTDAFIHAFIDRRPSQPHPGGESSSSCTEPQSSLPCPDPASVRSWQ